MKSTTRRGSKPAARPLPPEVVAELEAHAPAERTAEQAVTILSQQIAFARNHFFALVQRFAATKVENNQLSWDQGTEIINREMSQLDAALTQIGGGST